MVTLKEATRQLGFSYDGVYRHYRAGRIPAQKVGGTLLVDVRVVKAVLEGVGYQPRRKQEVK